MNPTSEALHFLVSFAFDIYILVILLRLVLQWFRADFYNPVCQFIVKVTQPVIAPVRRIVPSFGGIDMATLLILITLLLVEIWILRLILHAPLTLSGLLVLGVAQLLSKVWWLFVICIFIQVIMSWVNPAGYNPAMSLVFSITTPILRPAQRVLPPVSGFDLSPILVLLAFGLVKILFIQPIHNYGNMLTVSPIF